MIEFLFARLIVVGWSCAILVLFYLLYHFIAIRFGPSFVTSSHRDVNDPNQPFKPYDPMATIIREGGRIQTIDRRHGQTRVDGDRETRDSAGLDSLDASMRNRIDSTWKPSTSTSTLDAFYRDRLVDHEGETAQLVRARGAASSLLRDIIGATSKTPTESTTSTQTSTIGTNTMTQSPIPTSTSYESISSSLPSKVITKVGATTDSTTTIDSTKDSAATSPSSSDIPLTSSQLTERAKADSSARLAAEAKAAAAETAAVTTKKEDKTPMKETNNETPTSDKTIVQDDENESASDDKPKSKKNEKSNKPAKDAADKSSTDEDQSESTTSSSSSEKSSKGPSLIHLTRPSKRLSAKVDPSRLYDTPERAATRAKFLRDSVDSALPEEVVNRPINNVIFHDSNDVKHHTSEKPVNEEWREVIAEKLKQKVKAPAMSQDDTHTADKQERGGRKIFRHSCMIALVLMYFYLVHFCSHLFHFS